MKLVHPEDPKTVIDASPQYAAMYQSQGYVEASEKPDKKSE